MAREKLTTDVRREQILLAVLNLIATRGAKALSMAAVARRVGVVPSALYRHFKNKDEILDAAIEMFQQRVLENFQEVTRETARTQDMLYRLLRRQIRMIRENQILAMPRIVFSDDLFVSRPQRKARVYRMVEGLLNRLTRLLQQGQARGDIRADVDAASIARVFLAMIQSAAILWHISDGRYDVTQHAERSWQVLRSAIEIQSKRKGK